MENFPCDCVHRSLHGKRKGATGPLQQQAETIASAKRRVCLKRMMERRHQPMKQPSMGKPIQKGQLVLIRTHGLAWVVVADVDDTAIGAVARLQLVIVLVMCNVDV